MKETSGHRSVADTAAARLVRITTPVLVWILNLRWGGRAHLAGGVTATGEEDRRTQRGHAVAFHVIVEVVVEVRKQGGEVGAHSALGFGLPQMARRAASAGGRIS